MASAAQLAILAQALTDVRIVSYSNASALALLSYDILITLSEEIEYIWRTPWNIPKFLYFIGRYYAPIHIGVTLIVDKQLGLSVSFCKHYWVFWDITPILYSTLLNIFFVMRIHAIYNRSVKVLGVLIALLVVEFGAELGVIVVVIKETIRTTFVLPPMIGYPGCLGVPSRMMNLFAWIPAIIVALTFFIMTVVKLVVITRTEAHGGRTVFGMKYPGSLPPLLIAFFRDGALFFLLIFAILLVCTCTSLAFNGPLAVVAFPWLIVIYSFAATRLLLNIRKASMLAATPDHSATLAPMSFQGHQENTFASRA